MKNIILTLLVYLIIPADTFSQKVTIYPVGNSQLTEVSFVDTAKGWIAGDTTLFLTTDGGNTWSTVNHPSGQFLSISACKNNVAWTCWWTLDYNYLSRTTNNGTTWSTLLSWCNGCISQIYYAHIKSRDSLRAWVAEGAGSPLADYVNVIKTSDGGLTWVSYLPSHGYPYSIFTDITLAEDSGVATLFGQKIINRSIDDGVHWRSDTLPRPCNGISIGGQYQFWAVGDSGLVYHSSGYNIAFSKQSAGFVENFNAVFAIDTQTIWTVGTRGAVAKTTNGGVSWQRIPSTTTATLKDIFFVDANHGWIVGDSGIVLRIRNGLVTSVSKSSSPSKYFSLFQNYPNPFNPSTTISFSLPFESFVSLKIFDVLGREITTLFGEELSAGNHSKIWNTANLPSGIYFSRLQAETFIETKKLVLLK
jgi:hypothetical protein